MYDTKLLNICFSEERNYLPRLMRKTHELKLQFPLDFQRYLAVLKTRGKQPKLQTCYTPSIMYDKYRTFIQKINLHRLSVSCMIIRPVLTIHMLPMSINNH